MQNQNWKHEGIFELFIDNEMLDFICLMTNNYAIEKSANNWVPLTPAELRCFIAILLSSGYVQLPSYKMYWEEAFDVQHKLMSPVTGFKRYFASYMFAIIAPLIRLPNVAISDHL